MVQARPHPEVQAGTGGLEPPTFTSVAWCSVQLSYVPGSRRWDSNPHPPGSKPGALPDCATPRDPSVLRFSFCAHPDRDTPRLWTYPVSECDESHSDAPPLRTGRVRAIKRETQRRAPRSEAVFPAPTGVVRRSGPTGLNAPLQARRAVKSAVLLRLQLRRSPRRPRKSAQSQRTHGEQQTSARLELKRRPEDVACRVHDSAFERDEPTRSLRTRQAFIAINFRLSRVLVFDARPECSHHRFGSPPEVPEARPKLLKPSPAGPRS